MQPRFQKLEDRVLPELLLWGPGPGSAWSQLCGLGKVPSPLWASVSLQSRRIWVWMEVGTMGPLLCLRNDPENLWVPLDGLKGVGFRGQRKLINPGDAGKLAASSTKGDS